MGTALQESDRLYRFKVNNKPELNKMHTAIDMGGNNLNNTDTINANNGNFNQSVSVNGEINADGNIRSKNGWLITKNDKGWLNEDHGGGFYMSDNDWIRTVNNKGIYTAGQVNGGTVRSDGRLSTGDVIGLDKVNVTGTACQHTGDISRDDSGAILSCQSGVWRNGGSLSQRQCKQIGNWWEETLMNIAVLLGGMPQD